MTDRLEVIAFVKRKDKSVPVRLGGAVVKDDRSIDLYLDVIPAPENGVWRMKVQKPRERDNASQRGSYDRQERTQREPEDDIPF